MTDEIKKHADKIVADQLDSYLMGDKPKAKAKVWSEDRSGGKWLSDEDEWDASQPKMPLFAKREQPKIVPRPVRIDERDRDTLKDWANCVRVSGGEADMSSFMVIKVADLLMRELENAMECGRLIWKSERDVFEAKLMIEDIVKKRCLFQTVHGELVPVVVK